MPKTTSKKKTASRVGGGGVGTKVSKLNLKIVIPIVVLVAALGGFYIFKKSSASSYSLSGGQEHTKTDGKPGYINTGGPLTSYSFNGFSGRTICTNITALKRTSVSMIAKSGGKSVAYNQSGTMANSGSSNLCVAVPKNATGVTITLDGPANSFVARQLSAN